MSQLGYTWYPQDWWTSNTFKRLKKFPLVRYAVRELIDLMYNEGKPIKMNREFLSDDFNIELSDVEFDKLMEFVKVDEQGNWWIDSVKRRLTKAETARENGKNGGRPRKDANSDKKPEENKTQKPTEKTQAKNPRNPPLEKEREIEIEIENKEKGKIKEIETYRQFLHLSISVEDFEQLKKIGYSKEQIDSILESIENYGPNKKYKSLFITAKNWLKKDYGIPKTKEERLIIENETEEERFHREWKAKNKTIPMH